MIGLSSGNISNLATALLKAQEHLKPFTNGACNDFFRSRYVASASVLEAMRAPLLADGLLIVQRPVER